MPVWLAIVAANAFIGLACYTRGLYLELKETKEKLKQAEKVLEQLEK